MVEERFRLPGSSYEQLVRIIQSYGHLDEAASPEDVSRVAGGIHPTEVSRNNGFLVAIGILEGGKKKQITEKGRALARALEYGEESEMRSQWRQVMAGNEFVEKVIAAVRIRKGMEYSTLQSHIAYSAGQPKTKVVLTGAGAVVDILLAAGLTQQQDGKLVAVVDEMRPPSEAPARAEDVGEVVAERPITSAPTLSAPPGGASWVFNIQIQIQCSPDDVETLGPKLRALLKTLSEGGPPGSN